MNYTKEQLDKLPRWAQSEINRLTSNNASLQEKLNQFYGVSETNTYISQGMKREPLPKDSLIQFAINQNMLSVRVEDGFVYILGHGVGNMVILPRTSNSFHISFIKP